MKLPKELQQDKEKKKEKEKKKRDRSNSSFLANNAKRLGDIVY